MKRSLIACLALLIAAAAFGQVVVKENKITLAWDPNSEADLSGYKLYQGTASGVYGAAIATIPVMPAPTYQITGLANGIYYFVVTAYNAFGESGYSNEVSAKVEAGPQPPTGLKIVSQPLVWMLDKKSVQVAWATNAPASSDVTYRRDGFLPSSVTDATPVTNHIQILSRLQPNQLYYYTVSSTAGADTVSESGSFVCR